MPWSAAVCQAGDAAAECCLSAAGVENPSFSGCSSLELAQLSKHQEVSLSHLVGAWHVLLIKLPALMSDFTLSPPWPESKQNPSQP